MYCQNCNDTGRVALINSVGRIYEFRKCPICTCKGCGGVGFERYMTKLAFVSFRECPACRPDRFDAHVLEYRKQIVKEWAPLLDTPFPRPFIKLKPRQPDHSPEQMVRNVDEYLHRLEILERVYRNCLGPLARMLRAITHNKDGSKR